MKKILFFIPLLSLQIGYSQNESRLFSESKKLSYYLGYGSTDYSKFKTLDVVSYNNSSMVNLGINYRLFEKKNYQFTLGAILNYSTLEYRANDGLSNTGSELFLDLPVKFEYNIPLGERFYVTPNIGLNVSAFLNSEQRYYQDYYFTGNSFETTLQTKPFGIGGLVGLEFNLKSNKGIFGISLGYSKSFTDTYEFNFESTSSNNSYIQSLKRDFYSIGFKFTPKK